MAQLSKKVLELKRTVNPVTYSSQRAANNEMAVDDRRVKGYLLVWGVPDDRGTVFIKGCCAKSLQERGPKSNAKYKIGFLNFHDQCDPLGIFDVLEEDDYGLYFECALDKVEGGEDIDRTLGQIRSGTLNQFSIGFNYIWDKVEYDEAREVFLLKEIDLYEGSVVMIGSNKETYAIRAGKTDSEEREELLEATEDFIKSMPRNRQLELRQLITKHISLSQIEPLEVRLSALKKGKPKNMAGVLVGVTEQFKL